MTRDATIRLYEGAEMKAVAERLMDINQPVPNPLLSWAFGAQKEDGSLGSFVVVQGVTLVEPLIVEPKDVGTLVPLQLLHRAAQFVRSNKHRRTFMHSTDKYVWDWLTRKHAMPIPTTERFFEWRSPCV